MTCFRFALTSAVILCAATASAQNQERKPIEARGTLQGAAPGALQILSDSKETLAVKLPAKAADISFTANAELSFLKPGQTVKFSALMDKKGKVKEPVTLITIFTPIDRTELGVYPENADSGPNPLEGLFSSEPKREEPKKRPKTVMKEQPYRVGGTITSLKGGKMTVAAGGMQIKCELADNVKLKVAMNNLTYAREGDKVDVQGWHYPAAPDQGITANQVSIIAANPLADEKKKPRAAPKAGESEEKEEKNDENKKPE